MNQIILADEQAIFRAGAARTLALEEDMRIVAQCDDAAKLRVAIDSYRFAIVIYSTTLGDLAGVLAQAKDSRCPVVAVAGKDEPIAPVLAAQLAGLIGRSMSAPELIETVRRVARGQRGVHLVASTAAPQDSVGARVLARLTPKEMQIVALIVQGCKNKEIALRLGTKEQVIKNYLRSVYDKSGVGDRLELALFVLHHKTLADAAEKSGSLLQRKIA
jgi:DNA-binding NarL/FixJ family response regulator